MQAAPRAHTPPDPSMKAVVLAERWELQKLDFCRLCNVSLIDSLSKIWRSLALIKK